MENFKSESDEAGAGDVADSDDKLSESRRSLIRLMEGMVYRCHNDRDWTIESLSEGALELTGYAPEDFMDNARITYGQLIVPEDRERVWEDVQAALRAREPFRLVYRIRAADGTIKWVWEQGAGLYSENGDVRLLEGMVLDITERVQAEKFLQLQRDLALQLSGSTELHEVLETTLKAILAVTGLDSGGIYLVDKESGRLDLEYSQGVSEEFKRAVRHHDKDSTYARLLHQGNTFYICCDETSMPEPQLTVTRREGLQGVAFVPIKAENEVIGVMIASSHSIAEISPQTRDAIAILAGQVGQAIMRARLMVEIKESEAKYRLLHDNAGEAIFTYDREGRFISVNRKACEKIGYNEEELVGRNIFEVGILRGQALEMAQIEFQRLMKEGRTLKGVMEIVAKNGSTILADMTAAPLLDKKGEVIGVSNIALDITARKMAEEALRRSEEELRVTFESTGTAMGIMETDGTIIRVNHEMEKLMSVSLVEVEGKRKYLEFVAEDSLPIMKDYARKLLAGEISGPVQFECGLTSENGNRIEAIVNASLLPGMNMSVFSVIDITEKKKYERLLEEKAEQLRNFLDVAAHELRHPATLLKGYAFTLQKAGETMDFETKAKALQAIDMGVDRLIKVVEELLDMARIERGRFAMQKENVEIEPLIERAVREIRDKGSTSPMSIEMKNRLGSASVDANQLVRLLIILLDNAVKYSPPHSTIEIRAEGREGEFVISVLDSGIGIPEEARVKVFDRFFQVEDVLRHGGPGLGLGLYIGSRIAKAHGGELTYEPREGGGSAFSFKIPRNV